MILYVTDIYKYFIQRASPEYLMEIVVNFLRVRFFDPWRKCSLTYSIRRDNGYPYRQEAKKG